MSQPPYNLSIKSDGNHIMLKYSQISSDFSNPIVRECRGLIIDLDYNTVCIGFQKFFNYGETHADTIDWSTAVVEEKIDGSLCKLSYYNGEWRVATNGTIDAYKAPLSYECQYKSFGELFDVACIIHGLDFELLNKKYTYMFELVSPYNRVVVPYDFIGLYHIGTRDMTTLEELEVDISIQNPKTYKCNGLSDLIEMANKLPYSEEGYVVKDAQYRRIKVKSPAYVAVHHLANGVNDKRLIELIRLNETEEFLTYFPEYKPHIDKLQGQIEELSRYLSKILDDEIIGKEFGSRKDFAQIVSKTKFPAFFFMWYDNKVETMDDWLWAMSNDKILEQLRKLDE